MAVGTAVALTYAAFATVGSSIANAPKKTTDDPKLDRVDPAEERLRADEAAKRRRKRSQGGYGFGSTRLTGPTGLGAPPPSTLQTKTLGGS